MGWQSEYLEHPFLLILSICFAVLFSSYVWEAFFGDVKGFVQDIKDAALPDLFACLMGRYWDGEWAELKLGVFILIFIGLVLVFFKGGLTILA